jgi:hypothetical protein
MSPKMHRRLVLTFLVATGACHSGSTGGGRSDAAADPADALPVQGSVAATQAFTALRAQLAAGPKTAAELTQAHPVTFVDKLPYDPSKAAYLDKLQATPLALNPAELEALGQHGFVLSSRHGFLTYFQGYKAIYQGHLPVYVSADSILYALHRSYDAILRTIESAGLVERLGVALHAMRTALPTAHVAGTSADATKDVDLYLAVALSLLEGKTAAPVAGGNAAALESLVTKASADDGQWEIVELFGLPRDVDFSQFHPRGHYTFSEELSRYFRAMIWLGRTEFRIIETLPDARQVFRRRQLEGALLVRGLIDGTAAAGLKAIDDVARAFVGEPDDVTVGDLDKWLAASADGDPGMLLGRADDAIAQSLLDGGWGAQRIASQIAVNGLDRGTLPLHRSFLLMGQRYIFDSHVFSNVVYDRVKAATVKRMLPNPLDVAFAALGNDASLGLLSSDLATYDYAAELGQMRALGDAHGAEFWSGNLYNLWISALRTLSPGADLRMTAQTGLPTITATEAWSRRILNTQMASWAELRHDTILYSKQSYTGAPACEYPDAYVDPYPAFWNKLAELARRGRDLIPALAVDPLRGPLGDNIRAYFGKLDEVARMLADMAERQRTGMPHTDAQLAFINQAVSNVPAGCTQGAGGWYPDLFFVKDESLELDPTIADVHTQPADEGGNPVGKVLHVGTGKPRLMVVTVDGCAGPRAYTGLASAYYETVTKDFKRLDDKEWTSMLNAAEPADVPWMKDLVSR